MFASSLSWDKVPTITSLAVGVAGCFIFYLSLKHYSRLAHIPGPFVAAFTDLWGQCMILQRRYYPDFIRDLHAQYGPVVRFGPNRISFADPAAIKTIMDVRSPYAKSDAYEPMVILSQGHEIASIISMFDEKQVSQVKKHIAAGFSQSTWLKQEWQVDITLRKLIAALQAKGSEPVRIDEWLGFWSFDTMSTLAFSDCRNYLDHEKDIDGIGHAVRTRFSHWGNWMLLPKLEKLLFKNFIAQSFTKPSSPIVKLAAQRIAQKRAAVKGTATASLDLMDRYLNASQDAPNVISPDRVLGLTISTLNAGSETVALATTIVIVELLTRPEVMERLEAEIVQANLSFPPPFADVDALPYLDAVIRESMRMNMQAVTMFEREIGEEGATICGVWIPPHTNVSVARSCTTRDVSTFGDDVELFRPERWIEATEAQRGDMLRANMEFGHGRRVCLGQHLAKIEMKKALAALLMNFKMSSAGQMDVGFEDNLKIARVPVRLATRL